MRTMAQVADASPLCVLIRATTRGRSSLFLNQRGTNVSLAHLHHDGCSGGQGGEQGAQIQAHT
jgi:hypothetical protein